MASALVLKVLSGGYVTGPDNEAQFYLIMIILVIVAVVSLILEIVGLVKAVHRYGKIEEDDPYSVKRRGIRYILLFVGATLLTAEWLCWLLYITYRYFSTH